MTSRYYGGDDADILRGFGNGSSTMFGYGGDDLIYMVSGTDRAYGGDGNDQFIWVRNDENDRKVDYVQDFADGDKLVFNGFDGLSLDDFTIAERPRGGWDVHVETEIGPINIVVLGQGFDTSDITIILPEPSA